MNAYFNMDTQYAHFQGSCFQSSGNQTVMVRWSVDSDPGSRDRKNGDHSRRMAAIRFYLLSRRQFSAHLKSFRLFFVHSVFA